MMLIKPSVSIIAVNYNGGEQNLKFLASVNKLNYPKDAIETIIVDNNSTDDSRNLIIKKFPDVTLIKLKRNIGYGPALNVAIKKARGQYFFILNNDVICDRQCLKILIESLLADDKIGIIGPKIQLLGQNGNTTAFVQTFNYVTGNISKSVMHRNKPFPVQWIQGCAMLIGKSTFEKIGLFDPGFAKIYFEDLDLCLRVQRAGLLTISHPGAICYHRESYTISKIPLSLKWYYWHKNKIRFVLKHANILQITSILIFQFLASIYWNIAKKQPHFKSLVRAIVWNIFYLRQTLAGRKQ